MLATRPKAYLTVCGYVSGEVIVLRGREYLETPDEGLLMVHDFPCPNDSNSFIPAVNKRGAWYAINSSSIPSNELPTSMTIDVSKPTPHFNSPPSNPDRANVIPQQLENSSTINAYSTPNTEHDSGQLDDSNDALSTASQSLETIIGDSETDNDISSSRSDKGDNVKKRKRSSSLDEEAIKRQTKFAKTNAPLPVLRNPKNGNRSYHIQGHENVMDRPQISNNTLISVTSTPKHLKATDKLPSLPREHTTPPSQLNSYKTIPRWIIISGNNTESQQIYQETNASNPSNYGQPPIEHIFTGTSRASHNESTLDSSTSTLKIRSLSAEKLNRGHSNNRPDSTSRSDSSSSSTVVPSSSSTASLSVANLTNSTSTKRTTDLHKQNKAISQATVVVRIYHEGSGWLPEQRLPKDNTISSLKSILVYLCGMPAMEQRLSLDAAELHPDTPLSSFASPDRLRTRAIVLSRRRKDFSVLIQTAEGKETWIDMEPTAYVADLENAVADKLLRGNTEAFHLILGGHRLSRLKTLKASGVKNGHLIHLVLDGRAGEESF